jgi:hypothetical protein
VAEIRARFGLTEGELRGMRLRGGWTARTGIAEPGPLTERSRPLGRESHQYRLNRLLTVGVAMLETKVGEEGMNEANARALTELMRAQEISMRSRRNEKAAKAREKKNSDAGYDFRDDPDWLIAEINRKIDRIAQAGDAGGGKDRAHAADPEGAGSGGA